MKPGRNDPCPCGSGRKFKHCCGLKSAPGGAPARAAPAPAARDFAELVRWMAAGRYAEVENAARAIVARFPTYGPVWKLLSVALIRQGKDPLQALQWATVLLPQDAESHSNLAHVLQLHGRHAAALSSAERAIALQSRFPEALNNLGNALLNLDKPAEAAVRYAQAIALNPDYAEAHSNLGNAQRDLGRLEEAAASTRRALELNPSLAEAHSNLGNVLRDLGGFEEAVASYQRALAVRANYPAACRNLANTLRHLGRYEEALGAYSRALALQPDSASTLADLGHALQDLGRLDQAAGAYQRALRLQPEAPSTQVALARTQRLMGHHDAAEAACLGALALQPQLAPALAFLGELRADQGRMAEAEELARRAVSIAPDLPEGWVGLARHRPVGRADEAWLGAVRALLAKPLALRAQIDLHYALGKYFDDTREYAQAFAHYREANELTRRFGLRAEPERLTQHIERTMRTYDASWLQTHRAASTGSDRAVFVVGLPGSGTTLVEQILGAHPAVFDAGEPIFWVAAAAGYERAVSDGKAGAELIPGMAGEYLGQLRSLAAGAQRVVDQRAENFMHLGLIHAALPDARIIHVQRHPIDTALSMYFQNVAIGHAYAHDLDAIAHYAREYLRLMEHWRTVLPPGILLEVAYEQLIADPRGVSRQLLAHVGLPWDERCVDVEHAIPTGTAPRPWPVPQPPSAAASGRWRHYEQFIGPLLALADRAPSQRNPAPDSGAAPGQEPS